MSIYPNDVKDVIVKVQGINLSNDSSIDPTSSNLQMGFVSSLNGGQVPPTSWIPATWISNTVRQLFYAMCLATGTPGLAGPVTIYLPVGSYVPWVFFTLGAETIQEPCGDTVTVLA